MSKLSQTSHSLSATHPSELLPEERQGEAFSPRTAQGGKQLYLESYGCAMNFSDSELVVSILAESGYTPTKEVEQADLILLNTCAIRENAEQRIRARLRQFNQIKRERPSLTIGVLGCMAERLKEGLLDEEKLVDMVVGPDAYRDLPSLVEQAGTGHKAVNVLLSREETYADLSPVRLGGNKVSAFISIMRGCDNMCSFCVVPFTRGRERSRDYKSIVHEATYLVEQGYKEVTLLGQNVDSYRWNIDRKDAVIDAEQEHVNFASLLERVARVSPELRVRFSTSHPKDMTDEVMQVMSRYDNICDHIHLPVQSGSSSVLDRMNRNHSREWFLDRIAAIRKYLPQATISTDIMTGFCGETDAEHADTVSLMREVAFDFSYMYAYSERPKTLAERKLQDDIPESLKKARLSEVIDLQRDLSQASNDAMVGQTYEVLVEGLSKRSDQDYIGRTSQNVKTVFPKQDAQIGDYVQVRIDSCTRATLIGHIAQSDQPA